MAETTIMHEITQLREVVSRMEGVSRSVKTVSDTLTGIRNVAMGAWSGEAAAQFGKNGAKLQQNIASYLEDLNLSKTVLSEAITAYEKTEGTVAGTVNKLDTKGIF